MNYYTIKYLNSISTTVYLITSIGSLYVTCTTSQNNAICSSTLNVSGVTTLSNDTNVNGTLNGAGPIIVLAVD
jgi:hypothetical protein